MGCEDYQLLMADALGNELAESDRCRFEDHLAACETCRREYEASSKSVQMLRSLPEPSEMDLARNQHEWVGSESARQPIRRGLVTSSRLRSMRILRQAASIALAFTAGFGVHGMWTASRFPSGTADTLQHSFVSDDPNARAINESSRRSRDSRLTNNSFEAAVARAQSARPDRSAWFNTVAAMYSTPQ
ncbi:MAG: zf-HC2 domain-containing protein [Planctomycetota bacterium]